MAGLTIGQVARQSAVNIETVRYYERRGLIAEPPRKASGYRQYDHQVVQRIQFIKRAQGLGFTLKEIGQLLALANGDGSSCGNVRDFATKKVADVESKIRHLQNLKKVLTHLVRQCSEKGSLAECPIIESLAGDTGAEDGKRRRV